MKTAITIRVRMRLVPRIDQRTPVHRVDTHEHAKKIGPLRNLINAQLAGRAFRFDPHFAGAGEDLPGN